MKSPVLLQVQPARPVVSIDWQGLLGQYVNPEGMLMVGILLALVILSSFSPGKGRLTSGRFAGTADKLRAMSLLLRYAHPKTCYPCTLWSGTPRYWFGNRLRLLRPLSAQLQTLLGTPPTVPFPDPGRGLLVIGAPGSGKTFSVIDRVYESAYQQGFSGIIYDKKGDQMKLHASLAARYGYKVWVFAPGEPFSDSFNPLDQMHNSQDSVMAGEIGRVIARNFGSEGKSNEFFDKAEEMLAKGLVQLAKGSRYPDLAMVYAFAQLPDLVNRLDYAANRPKGHPLRLDPWIAPSFSQLLSSKEAEKTVAGIRATAESAYNAFIQKDLLRAFIGRSSVPTRLEGKQLVIFKLDDRRRSVLSPLLAASLHLSVVSNLATKRSHPFFYGLDELPSINLPDLVFWVNEYRSNGGIPIIGIQSLNQLFDAYGDKRGAAIASALSTHVLFNPGDYDTAEKYSKRYGETEVTIRTRSTGSSTGGHTSRSTNWSEQLHKKPLLSPDQIMRLPQGKCVITLPPRLTALGTNRSFPTCLRFRFLGQTASAQQHPNSFGTPPFALSWSSGRRGGLTKLG